MQTASCPNCGAPLSWSSPALPVKVCDRCHSVIVRRDEALEKIGDAAMLPFDVSPVQMGTQGQYWGVGFSVVGRIRWGWEQGAWNEWLCLFDDGSSAWLGEAMGDFMLTREVAITDASDGMLRELAAGRPPQLGMPIIENGIHYIASDLKTAKVLAQEGELPFRSTGDWTIESTDFRSVGREIASFQRDADGVGFYVGDVVSLGDIRAYNLRTIDGWNVPDFVNA